MSLPPSLTRLGEELLDQQLWAWGLDIGHAEGNLLLRYGCQRLRAPSRDAGSSCYRLDLPAGRSLSLWGWGVLWGIAGAGGVFLRRHPFVPRLTSLVAPVDATWRLQHLPDLRAPRDPADRQRVQHAVSEFAAWVAGYERWVHEQLGPQWRMDGVAQRPRRVRRRLTVPPERTPEAWQRLAQACAAAQRVCV